jgi:ribulose-phosphate 3-epimerase
MLAFVSLWSADLLALRDAVRQVEDLVDGFHIDVFDGHNADHLLFGPDLVVALRRTTTKTIDVHLNVDDPCRWIDRFADAGADTITVQSGPCPDVGEVLAHIRERGCDPGLGVEVHEPIDVAVPFLDVLSRVLLLGTPIGVKGRDLDPATTDRIAALIAARERAGVRPSIIVDGGIRKHTAPTLAAAGADGVIPGALVYGDRDPRRAASEIANLEVGTPRQALSAFWSEEVSR